MTTKAKKKSTKNARTKTSTKSNGNERSIVELIVHKRGGGALSKSEIDRVIDGFRHGDVADYQMSAFLMATFFRGMTPEETTALTLAMRDSGTVVDLSSVRGIKVDKHSTGGVGDKVSLCLAPLVAACGVPIPMVSGRGLGHTGGTLDKLEAIPGFNVSMPVPQFVKQVRDVGCALIGQTADIAPADKRIYALRDVTGTVESIPLITASILSKKLAEGIDALVLDVKVGRGAFMKTIDDARELARSIVRVGTLAKKRVSAILTSMEAPLGFAVGNALETAEAIDVLLGRGPDDLVECTLVLGAEMLRLGGVAKSEAQARKMLNDAIRSRKGARVFENIIRAQKGDPRVVEEPDRLPRAPRVVGVKSHSGGYVTGIDALEIGLSAVAMGAGRTRADQAVDPAVGIVLHKKLGDKVAKGEVLAEVHVRDKAAADRICGRIREAYEVAPRAKKTLPLVLDTIRR